MKEIRSASNPLVKEVRELLSDARARRRERLWVAEGVRLVEEVVRSGRPVRLAFWSEPEIGGRKDRLTGELESRAAKCAVVARGVMRELSDTLEPQGVLAVFEPPEHDLAAVAEGPGPVVVLDRLRDPGNLGTLARSAEAAGAAGLILTAESVDAGNPKALRASMGSLLRLPVVRGGTPDEVLGVLDRPAYAAAGGGGLRPEEADLARPVVLVLGQEAEGVSPEWMEKVSGRITIPMEGGVESLNVAVAGSVLLFEAARQRRLSEKLLRAPDAASPPVRARGP